MEMNWLQLAGSISGVPDIVGMYEGFFCLNLATREPLIWYNISTGFSFSPPPPLTFWGWTHLYACNITNAAPATHESIDRP